MKKRNGKARPVLMLAASNIKAKPVRFAITIVLFAATLFFIGAGYSATQADPATAYYRAHRDTEEKTVLLGVTGPDSDMFQSMASDTALQIAADYPDYDFLEIYNYSIDKALTFGEIVINDVSFYKEHLDNAPSGFVVLDAETMAKYRMTFLAGDKLPEERHEIALTKYQYERFARNGYLSGSEEIPITAYADMIGKTLLGQNEGNIDNVFTVVAVIDTGFDIERYAAMNLRAAGLKSAGYDYNQEQLAYSLVGETTHHNTIIISRKLANDWYFDGRDYAAFRLRYTTEHLDLNGFAVNLAEAVGEGVEIRYAEGKSGVSAGEVILPKSYLKYVVMYEYPVFLFNPPSDEVTEAYLNDGLEIPVALSDNYAPYNVNNAGRDNLTIVGYWDDGDEAFLQRHPYLIFSDGDLASIAKTEAEKHISYLVTNLKGETSDKSFFSIIYKSYGENRIRLISMFDEDIHFARNLSEQFKNLGLIIGAVFTVFSLLMMGNFISSSIFAKKKEIGALSAMGAGKGFLLSVYLAEGFIAALAAACAAIIGMIIFTENFNLVPEYDVVAIKIFNIEYKQILAILGLGAVISAAGTAAPLAKLMRRRPAMLIK